MGRFFSAMEAVQAAGHARGTCGPLQQKLQYVSGREYASRTSLPVQFESRLRDLSTAHLERFFNVGVNPSVGCGAEPDWPMRHVDDMRRGHRLRGSKVAGPSSEVRCGGLRASPSAGA